MLGRGVNEGPGRGEAIVRAARELTDGNILGGDRHQPASGDAGVLDETRGGRDWCSKKVWRSRNGMGNRVNADRRWDIESCPSRRWGSLLGWARLDLASTSTRLEPYRSVPYRTRTVADRGVRTRVAGHRRRTVSVRT